MSKRKPKDPFTGQLYSGCTRKVPFLNERMAQKRADEIKDADGRTLGTYKCQHCKKWHLTSKVQFETKSGRRWIDDSEFKPVPESE